MEELPLLSHFVNSDSIKLNSWKHIVDDAFKHVTTSTPIKEGHENRKETIVLLGVELSWKYKKKTLHFSF